MLKALIREIFLERRGARKSYFQLGERPDPVKHVINWAKEHGQPNMRANDVIYKASESWQGEPWGDAARNLMIQHLESMGFKY